MNYAKLIIDKLSNEVSISKVLLFGSRARNNSTERSDYDLCIVVNDYSSKESIMTIIVDIMKEYNILIHPFIYTEEDYNQRKDLSMYKNAFADAKVIINR